MSNEILSSITETNEINNDAKVIISQTEETEENLYSVPLENIANKLEQYHDINILAEKNLVRETLSENLFDNNFDLDGYFNLSISDDKPHGFIEKGTYKATSKFYAIPENTNALYIENIKEAVTFTVCLYTDKNDSSYSSYINKSRIIQDETATGGMRAIDSSVKYFRVYVDADFAAGENNVIISNKTITADTPVEFKEEVTQKSGAFKEVLDKYVQTSEFNQIVDKVDNLFAGAIFEGGRLLCGSGRVSSSNEHKRTGYISIPEGTSDLYVRLSDKPKTEFTILFYSINDSSDATELYKYTEKFKKLVTSKKQHISFAELGFDEGGKYAMRIYTDVDFAGDVLISPVITPEEGIYKITDSFASEMLSVMKKDVDENRLKKLREFSENIKDDIERFSAFCSSGSMSDNVKVYHVGKGCEFETIQEALAYWEETDNFAPAIVYISNGVYTYDDSKAKPAAGGYNSVIFVDSSENRPKNISFIGESREGVIIKSTSGEYIDAPILIRHGNVQIKNMTVIADHSENPDFSYESDDNFAYAIHIDGGNNNGKPGKVLVENVTAVSYQAPAFGMGTIPDSTIRLENCKSISFTERMSETEEGASLRRGSLLCHKADKKTFPERGDEKLELVNVEIYSENMSKPLILRNNYIHCDEVELNNKNIEKLSSIESSRNENGDLVYSADYEKEVGSFEKVILKTESFNLLAVNTVLASGNTEDGKGLCDYQKATDPQINGEIVGGDLVLDPDSCGNTCEKLNA